MAPVARCLLLTTNVTLWTVGAALLSGGLVALLRPEWEISRVLLDDDSGRPPAEIAGFYVVSGGMLLLISMLGCGGSCGERYAWMVVYVSLMSLVTAALTVYLGLQLNACIKERVCTKNFDVNSRRHWSILVQSLAVFVLGRTHEQTQARTGRWTHGRSHRLTHERTEARTNGRLVTLTLATTVCCKARARRGYLAVPV